MGETRQMFEPYASVQMVAAFLEIHEQTVRQYVREGLFRDGSIADPEEDVSVVEVGGEVRIAHSAVNRFLRARVRVTSPVIVARNRGELKRKLAGARARQRGGDTARTVYFPRDEGSGN